MKSRGELVGSDNAWVSDLFGELETALRMVGNVCDFENYWEALRSGLKLARIYQKRNGAKLYFRASSGVNDDDLKLVEIYSSWYGSTPPELDFVLDRGLLRNPNLVERLAELWRTARLARE